MDNNSYRAAIEFNPKRHNDQQILHLIVEPYLRRKKTELLTSEVVDVSGSGGRLKIFSFSSRCDPSRGLTLEESAEKDGIILDQLVAGAYFLRSL